MDKEKVFMLGWGFKKKTLIIWNHLVNLKVTTSNQQKIQKFLPFVFGEY